MSFGASFRLQYVIPLMRAGDASRVEGVGRSGHKRSCKRGEIVWRFKAMMHLPWCMLISAGVCVN